MVQVARVDRDPLHHTSAACARARNAGGRDASAGHLIAQRPVAAAKIRRCGVKVHEPAAGRGRSSAHGQPALKRNSLREPRNLGDADDALVAVVVIVVVPGELLKRDTRLERGRLESARNPTRVLCSRKVWTLISRRAPSWCCTTGSGHPSAGCICQHAVRKFREVVRSNHSRLKRRSGGNDQVCPHCFRGEPTTANLSQRDTPWPCKPPSPVQTRGRRQS